MKALLFIAYTTGMLYAANRWEWISYTLLWLFIAGAFFLVTYSAYRWLNHHRWL